MEKFFEIKNLCIEYKNLKNDASPSLKAVKNVSFNINRGEIFALAGESGCGKSSIAKAIMKLILPAAGNILYEGEDI